jgi:SAM-dependent methyltransferase
MPTEEELSALYAEESLEPAWEAYIERCITPPAFHRLRLGRIEALVPPGCLLDVGAGFGHFVREARARGWQEVRGLDTSPKVAEIVRRRHGFDIDVGQLGGRYADAHFDCVHVKDVIEHLRDPLVELRECRRILKPDGLIVVETLNTDSAFARIQGGRYRGFIPGHVALFGPRALSIALSTAGFEVVERHAGDEIPLRAYLSCLPPAQALRRAVKKLRVGDLYAASMVVYGRGRD